MSVSRRLFVATQDEDNIALCIVVSREGLLPLLYYNSDRNRRVGEELKSVIAVWGYMPTHRSFVGIIICNGILYYSLSSTHSFAHPPLQAFIVMESSFSSATNYVIMM